MNEMTLPSKHRIRNSVWGQAHYLSVTEIPHNIEYLRMSREEQLWSSKARAGFKPNLGRTNVCINIAVGIFGEKLESMLLTYFRCAEFEKKPFQAEF